MTVLTKLIIAWRGDLPLELQRVGNLLPPLNKIAARLNSDELNESVHIRDNPCVEEDIRIPLVDFKRMLLARLFATKRVENEMIRNG